MNTTSTVIPTTLEEAMTAFKELFSPEDTIKFFRMKRDDLGSLHHGLGQWIRNNWGLWHNSELAQHMVKMGFIHADDMSQSLIVEYWNRLHELPSQLQDQIAYYKKYWAKTAM